MEAARRAMAICSHVCQSSVRAVARVAVNSSSSGALWVLRVSPATARVRIVTRRSRSASARARSSSSRPTLTADGGGGSEGGASTGASGFTAAGAAGAFDARRLARRAGAGGQRTSRRPRTRKPQAVRLPSRRATSSRGSNSTPPLKAPTARSRKKIRRSASGRSGASGHRQRQPERGAALAPVLGGEGAAEGFQDAGRDRQPQTVAAFLRRVEGLEDVGQHGERNAAAAVVHLDHHAARLGVADDGDLPPAAAAAELLVGVAD